MSRARKGLALTSALLAFLGAAAAVSPEEAKRVVLETRENASGGFPGQIAALIDLAWFKDGTDPVVRSAARDQLAAAEGGAIEALMFAMDRVEPRQCVEVVDVLMRAHAGFTGMVHPNFEPALVAAIWNGDRAAKRLAIPELTLRRNRHAVLPLIDSAIEDPELTRDVVRALGGMGDDRARFYLEQILNGTDPEIAQEAAVALARIGGKGLTVLHPAMRSSDRRLRMMAVRSLIPAATESDLSALYEYLVNHGDDDPQLSEVVRRATEVIEAAIEARRASEAASAVEDF